MQFGFCFAGWQFILISFFFFFPLSPAPLTAQWLLYVLPALSFITLYISDVLHLHILLILWLNFDYFCKRHSLTSLCNGDTVWFFCGRIQILEYHIIDVNFRLWTTVPGTQADKRAEHSWDIEHTKLKNFCSGLCYQEEHLMWSNVWSWMCYMWVTPVCLVWLSSFDCICLKYVCVSYGCRQQMHHICNFIECHIGSSPTTLLVVLSETALYVMVWKRSWKSSVLWWCR